MSMSPLQRFRMVVELGRLLRKKERRQRRKPRRRRMERPLPPTPGSEFSPSPTPGM